MAAGVPAVVVPLIADQTHNARRVAELGAGVSSSPDDIVRLPDAVRALLADGSYREAAGRVAAEMRGCRRSIPRRRSCARSRRPRSA